MKSIGINVVTTKSGNVQVTGDMQYSDILINAADVVYTKAIDVSKADIFGVFYTAVSTLGGIDLKIEVQTSFILPVTEGATDTYWSEPVNMADIVASLTVESTIYHQALAIPPCKYLRFKITGAAGNSADTLLNMWLAKQSDF